MELAFKINTNDLYGEDGIDFESLFTDSLTRAVTKNAKEGLASNEFKKFSQLTSDTIVADIKLRMQNFLSEEIILTGGYGEKEFVGSIEDLIKKRFDDVLLRPVDNSGKTLKGCTSHERTWIEWQISKKLEDFVKDKISYASRDIKGWVEKMVTEKLIEIKNSAIQDQVNGVFAGILKQEKV